MADFRFIHTADLHLGRRFGALPDDLRGRLVEARHGALHRLAEAARSHGARHVLVAGDLFDSETPSDPVWRQALQAMARDAALHWWIIPGNHDSLAAESLWSRFRAQAPAQIHLLDAPERVEIEPGVALLPAPLPRRYAGRDLTAWMPGCATAPGELRLGLAHGAVLDFSEEGARAGDVIPPDRAATARLDYLALGDWHGQLRLTDRCWYAGTPERDAFGHAGPGACLAVTLAGPGALPEVRPVPTGQFLWSGADLPLLPGQDAAAALAAALPQDRAGRRDQLIRLRATGRATLAEQAALAAAARHEAPDFAWFDLDTAQLGTEVEAADLDAIDRAGALRLAAETLRAQAGDLARDAASRSIAAAALNRLYGYLQEDRA